MNTPSFLHAGNTGDIIAALPAIKEYSRQTGKKVILYLQKNQRAVYYEGATHPVVDERGCYVALNDYMIKMLIPLLKCQEYIADAKEWENEPVTIDLNDIRTTFTNIPYGSISRWYFYVWPDLACDLSRPWLTIPADPDNLAKDMIIVCRTQRYQHPLINYSFLKQYGDQVLFAGTENEHELFCKEFDLTIPRLYVENFLQFAQAIQQCKFYLSNQSMGLQIAEGLKHPRIVEICNFAPNVIPVGENAYDFLGQGALEYYCDLLYKKTSPKGGSL